ncbi:MAG: DUF4965 domain-containing protein [Planctomycetaceae bacterium]|jgi:hypothetical protein|nr:DUF4965 domain-containing protein [Planctomycetaceae bacterium]
MKILTFFVLCFVFLTTSVTAIAEETVVNLAGKFRPPAVPLVVHDPYFSIWSPADKLTDAETVHWTGAKHPLHCMIRIDDKTYRLMGAEPADVPAMEQTELFVSPMITMYKFRHDNDIIEIFFISLVLPSNLDLLSRPVTYILYSATTSKPANIAFYFDAGGEIAVNTPEQKVQWNRLNIPDTTTIKLGTVEQNILGRKGDNVRIDWGHLIFSVKNFLVQFSGYNKLKYNVTIGKGETLRQSFVENKLISEQSYSDNATAEAKDAAIAFAGFTEQPENYIWSGILLAYDDEYSIRYFEDDLRPWWKRNNKSTETMITEAWNDLASFIGSDDIARILDLDITQAKDLNHKFENFTGNFLNNLKNTGGKDYANLCALAYRQVLGAQKIVADKNGMPLMFSKENFSNGSIGTVDVMYPASPMLLYYSPAMMKATLQPILDYSASKRWKFPFAPHDIGTYPHATGQTYGGAESSEKNQMPVEESANMLIQVAALAFVEGHAEYAKLHWSILTKWAEYLLEKGYDPENQLCTDDFAGHLAHNINLSAKAIIALGCYAQLAEMLGEKENAAKYRKTAEKFAARWVQESAENDHTKLAFDKPDTWSMKYNLMWNEILNLKLFPREVIDKELAFYKTKINRYGLPLDSRQRYTKVDWILWTAAMTNNRNDFDIFLKPVIDFINDTDKRVPITDWYMTDTAKMRAMQARSVVGGFWAPMLKNAEQWKTQAKQGADISGQWAPLSISETVGFLVPTAQFSTTQSPTTQSPTTLAEKPVWRYTFEKPSDNWNTEHFDATAWKEGQAGFGTKGTPDAIVNTVWNSNDIWLRRTFELTQEIPKDCEVRLSIHHDEDVDVYLNGKLILQQTGYTTNYITKKSVVLKETLRSGKNTLAVHCRQTIGGQYIDVSLVLVKVNR